MGTNAVAKLVPEDKYEQREMIDAIKQTVCRGATDAQLKMFIEVCRSTGLNPWLREVWYVAEKGIIMAARDGYLRVANENPHFDGIETRVERDEKSHTPIKAVCTVWRKDRNHPTVCEAFFNEYNKNSPVWKQYPSAMIGKVAEVLALKRSFAINGVVTEEEVGEAPAQPQGSQQAQDDVRDRKLAEIRSRQQQQPDPVAEEAPTSSTLDQILATFTNAATVATAFEQMKEHFCKLLDAPVYDQILAENGLAPGEQRTLGKCKKCFKVLWNAYHAELARVGSEQEQPV